MAQPEFSDLSTFGMFGPQNPMRVRRVEPELPELPDDSALPELLGELSELLGGSHHATAYQLYATEDLPETYEGELVDERMLIRRLLRYAGEHDDDLTVELVDGRAAERGDFADHLSGSLAYAGLTGEDLDQLGFVVFDLGDLRAMMGPTCVEVARALIHRARLASKGAGYRDGGLMLDDELPTPLEGFLACFVLGWGVPVANACLDPRSAGSLEGDTPTLAWVAAALHYPPALAARLLAIIYRASARDPSFLASRRATLNPSQRELFDEAWAELEGDGPALREQLRWSEPETWPAPRERAVDELTFDAHDEALVAAETRHREMVLKPRLGQPVFRARPRRTLFGMVLGAAAVLLHPVLGLVGVAVGAIIGYRIRGSYCSAPGCAKTLDSDDIECPRCGGTIVGDIERAKDHLHALEDFEARGELPELAQ